jgi:hypothetical protein
LGSRASIARFARAFFGFRIAMDISKTHVRTLPKKKKKVMIPSSLQNGRRVREKMVVCVGSLEMCISAYFRRQMQTWACLHCTVPVCVTPFAKQETWRDVAAAAAVVPSMLCIFVPGVHCSSAAYHACACICENVSACFA